MISSLPVIERAKPLLGTTVRIRIAGLETARAHAAISAAFARICAIHGAMSFHEETSDVSRLNARAHVRPIAVSAETYMVLARSLEHSAITDGVFDVTVAPQLAARGHLPRPSKAPQPDGGANWHDIILLPERRVQFRRPLWIDLGGIAKGYAVDAAMETLLRYGPSAASVNAGGDIRICGRERVVLAAPDRDNRPVVEIHDGALASSEAVTGGPHIGPQTPRFAAVVAPHCIDADALTKIALARGADAAACLEAFGAQAFIYDRREGWRQIGLAA